jgi:Mor family transcriptional regulator
MSGRVVGEERERRDEERRLRDIAIAERYVDGELVDLIAAEYGLAAGSIRQIANRAGATRRFRNRSASGERAHGTELRNREIRSLYEDGVGFQEIADRHGVSRQRVEQIVRVDRHRARKLAAGGIASGRIVPADFCALCGSEQYIEAHHPRYDQPKYVTWLCHNCHMVADVCRRREESVAA